MINHFYKCISINSNPFCLNGSIIMSSVISYNSFFKSITQYNISNIIYERKSKTYIKETYKER